MLAVFAAAARSARQTGRLLPLCATVTSTTASTAPPASAATAGKTPLLKDINLYRFDPENDARPYYKTYRVDVNKCALLYLQMQILTYAYGSRW